MRLRVSLQNTLHADLTRQSIQEPFSHQHIAGFHMISQQKCLCLHPLFPL